MLLICPVRPGDSNEELRYAMRSWETNLHLGSDLRLMTVGHRPSWARPDMHLPANRYSSMPHAVFDNVRIGAGEAERQGYEACLYMNDDFFCLDPVGAVLPVRRNISLAEHCAKFPANASNWWPKSLRLTASWLAEVGFPHPDSFEVHRPLPATPSAMFEALSRWDLASGDTVPQWRTVYGTLNEVDAYPVVDAKLSPKTHGVGTPWISTSDQSWRRYALPIMKRFQKPSRWEKV
jgi:hypothetical protein